MKHLKRFDSYMITESQMQEIMKILPQCDEESFNSCLPNNKKIYDFFNEVKDRIQNSTILKVISMTNPIGVFLLVLNIVTGQMGILKLLSEKIKNEILSLVGDAESIKDEATNFLKCISKSGGLGTGRPTNIRRGGLPGTLDF